MGMAYMAGAYRGGPEKEATPFPFWCAPAPLTAILVTFLLNCLKRFSWLIIDLKAQERHFHLKKWEYIYFLYNILLICSGVSLWYISHLFARTEWILATDMSCLTTTFRSNFLCNLLKSLKGDASCGALAPYWISLSFLDIFGHWLNFKEEKYRCKNGREWNATFLLWQQLSNPTIVGFLKATEAKYISRPLVS